MPAILGLLLPLVWAMPDFDAEYSQDQQHLTDLWLAAEACTGRSGRATSPLRVEREPVVEGFEATSALGDAGLTGVRISDKAPSITLPHALARAWNPAAPPGLREGIAGLMADCVAQRLPDDLPVMYDGRTTMTGMPDLYTWRDGDDLTASQVRQGIIGATRLMRAAQVVLEEQLLHSQEHSGWGALETQLEQAGPRGAQVLEVLRGGLEAQKRALVDHDMDGLSLLEEQLLGLDPTRWDSDGDGWWDGKEPVNGDVVVLPRDGSPTCIPWVRPDGSPPTSTMRNGLMGANLSGLSMEQTDGVNIVNMGPGMRTFPGGVWIEVTGDDLQPSPRCGRSHRITLTADTVAGEAALPELMPLLEQALADAETTLPPLESRLVVHIGGKYERMTWVGAGGVVAFGQVGVPPSITYKAQQKGTLHQVAAQAIALALLGDTSCRKLSSPAAAGAMLYSLLEDKPSGKPMVDAHPSDIREWRTRGEQGKGGWAALLQKGC